MPLKADESFVVDMTNVRDRSGLNPVHQEPGDYKGVIKDLESGVAKNSGNKTLTFSVGDADRPSAVYRYNCTFTENSLWKLRNIVVAAGVALPKKRIKLTATMLNKLIGKEIGMTLEDDEYEGRMRSQIVNVFPVGDLPEDSDDTADEDDVDEKPAAKKSGSATKAKKGKKTEVEEDLDELDIDEL